MHLLIYPKARLLCDVLSAWLERKAIVSVCESCLRKQQRNKEELIQDRGVPSAHHTTVSHGRCRPHWGSSDLASVTTTRAVSQNPEARGSLAQGFMGGHSTGGRWFLSTLLDTVVCLVFLPSLQQDLRRSTLQWGKTANTWTSSGSLWY
jgi:hypothetical protein